MGSVQKMLTKEKEIPPMHKTSPFFLSICRVPWGRRLCTVMLRGIHGRVARGPAAYDDGNAEVRSWHAGRWSRQRGRERQRSKAKVGSGEASRERQLAAQSQERVDVRAAAPHARGRGGDVPRQQACVTFPRLVYKF